MVKPIAADFDWSRGAVSAVLFLNIVVYAASVIITGRLYDRYGPKWVIAGSTVLFSAGYALMATMDSLWEFLLYFGLLNGAGFGGVTIPLFSAIVGNWFEKHRGLAISLAIAGNCLGQFFLIPLFSDMIVVSGWRSTCLWIALASLVLNLALVFGVIRGSKVRVATLRTARTAATAERDQATGLPRAASGVATSPLARPCAPAPSGCSPSPCSYAGAPTRSSDPSRASDHGLRPFDATAANMLAWLGLLSLAGLLLAGPAADIIGSKLL